MQPMKIQVRLDGAEEFNALLWRPEPLKASLRLETRLIADSIAAVNRNQPQNITTHRFFVPEVELEENRAYFYYAFANGDQAFSFLLALSYHDELVLCGLHKSHVEQLARGNEQVVTLITAALKSLPWPKPPFKSILIGQYFPYQEKAARSWLEQFIDVVLEERPEGLVAVPGRGADLVRKHPALARLWFTKFCSDVVRAMNEENDADFRCSFAFAYEVALRYQEIHHDTSLLKKLESKLGMPLPQQST